MNFIINIVIIFLEIIKWLILASVLLSWLPMLGIQILPHHPVVKFIRQVTNPILKPFRPYSRLGMLDLSPIIVFFLIGLLQAVLRGGAGAVSQIISRVIVLVIAFTIHEFMHAFVAYRLGDPTAKNQGRLTLDPRRHLDVLGSLMLLAVGFGWAKPVPVNPNYLKNGPKAGMATVAVAGPLSNLLLAILAAILMRPLLTASSFSLSPALLFLPTPRQILIEFIFINVLLFFFNLLPIAPLDGFKVVAGLLPYPTSISFRRLEPAGPLILFVLLIFGRGLLDLLVSAPTRAVTQLLL